MRGMVLVVCLVWVRAGGCQKDLLPLVIHTWDFPEAAAKAWQELERGTSRLDAVVAGCSTCEELQCGGTVGYGGSPDEEGETTLDAMVLDGDTLNVGSVAGIRNIKNAISAARFVLERTHHSILVGDLATNFAQAMGLKKESLSTRKSKRMWEKWRTNSCQPNYWMRVTPDSKHFCGPYSPIEEDNEIRWNQVPSRSHDTISMAVLDGQGIVVGTSTNGLKFKIPGRVGDSPIPGAGAYADSTVGAGLATGDGDVMLRFLPSFLMVELMRGGASPQQATDSALARIAAYYPAFSGALIAVNRTGHFAAACHNIPEHFPFYALSPAHHDLTPRKVTCSYN